MFPGLDLPFEADPAEKPLTTAEEEELYHLDDMYIDRYIDWIDHDLSIRGV